MADEQTLKTRITNVAMTVHRDGRRIDLPANAQFKFTEKEIADFTKLNPRALRKPVTAQVREVLDPEVVKREKQAAIDAEATVVEDSGKNKKGAKANAGNYADDL